MVTSIFSHFPTTFFALSENFNSFVFVFKLLCKNDKLEGVYDLICKVNNAVFNNFSVIWRRPVHLSMPSWNSFNQYPAQYSSHATGIFPYITLAETKDSNERGMNPVQ